MNSPKDYEAIESAMAQAEALLKSPHPDPKAVSHALEQLNEAVMSYETGGTSEKGTHEEAGKKLKSFLPLLHQAEEAAENGHFKKAEQAYHEFHEGWEQVEAGIRSENPGAYGEIETKMAGVSAALKASPPDKKEAAAALHGLFEEVEHYGDEKGVASKEKGSIQTLIHELNEVQEALNKGDISAARADMVEFIQIWPSIEGQVSTKSEEVYTQTENNMTKALSLLSSNPPKTGEAKQVISEMKKGLEPLAQKTSYSAWDAAIILLREGLEVLLIVGALLAFLNRTDNNDKRGWIWGGVGAGIAASFALAFVLTTLFSVAVAGEEREFLEGITGLIAVLVMLTVGAWLHSRSNIAAWNQFINDKVGTALARGSLWSLAGVSMLTVLREGAETVIFYLGMIGSISTQNLILGIGAATLILVALGIAMIRFSVKLPMRPFFLTVSALIYYLAFKFTGESIHALQVVKKVESTHITGVPELEFFGMYPTLETIAVQAVVFGVILLSVLWTRHKQAQSVASEA
ncbi:ferrous iron permease EfeU [Marinithermofilum abyssi]|uniref:Ferrous iron permease EfeU n=1 Tax=Marinithermofilum abyssi TaxID=1571185 RepID=A0A8J2VFA1_9BACL|nr:FTR1 family protein [Marinithermofilum abyssi]GGE06757.1 ferrous iron permease EfeU [Marinithermofilum abyssi]